MRAMFGASLVCIVASTLVTIPISERQPEVAVSQAVALSGRRNRLTGLFESYVDALGDPPLRRLLALFAGMVAALVPSAVLFARHGSAARKMAIPFAPFLALGGLLALFAGHPLLHAYLKLLH